MKGERKIRCNRLHFKKYSYLGNNRKQFCSGERQTLKFNFSDIKMMNLIYATLQPFYQIHGAHYQMYRMSLLINQYKSNLDSIATSKKKSW
jgi:hypothetical protein